MIVFCITAFATVWRYRNQINELGQIATNVIFGVFLAFVLSITMSSCLALLAVLRMKSEAIELAAICLKQLPNPIVLPMSEADELVTVIRIGTSDYTLIAILWAGLWYYCARRRTPGTARVGTVPVVGPSTT
jgi:hypothetical protein